MNGRYFHHNISGIDAEKLLLEKGTDGSFLARPSNSCPNSFVISVLRNKKVTHIRVTNNGEALVILDGEKFATLSELVSFYMERPGQLKERDGELIDLKYPLYCEDPTTERWFHSKLSSKEAEKMLLDHGQDGSFLVRESMHKPGNYVLSVRNNDSIVHFIIERHTDGKFFIDGGTKFNTMKALINFYMNMTTPIVIKQGGLLSIKYPMFATRFNVGLIETRIKQLNQESDRGGNSFAGFFDEFELLDCEMQSFSREIGSLPENREKNRFKNILPIDATRVILRDEDPLDPAKSYINANYIHWPERLTALFTYGSAMRTLEDLNPNSFLLDHHPRYIATQGPMANTIVDFWRMIWQERCACIAMITKEIERDRNKCTRYWPTCEEKIREFVSRSGVIKVRLLDERNIESFIIREMEISKGSDSFTLWQYHFLVWPDHGAPEDPSCVINYMLEISDHQNRHPEAGPIVVHCSAGIGRTGTFIVIDMLINYTTIMGLDCEIDIFKLISVVREQRSGLVQTASQYQFVYKALCQFVKWSRTRMQAEETMVNDYTNIKRGDNDFCHAGLSPVAACTSSITGPESFSADLPFAPVHVASSKKPPTPAVKDFNDIISN